MIKSTESKDRKRGVADGIGDVVSDITSLAELQFDLFKLDCSESKRRMILPTIVIGVAVLFTVGMVPVFLLLLSSILYEAANFSISASIAISLGIGLVAAMSAFWFGLKGLRKALAYFERSSEELKRNVQWLKNLKQRGRRSRTEISLQNRGSLN